MQITPLIKSIRLIASGRLLAWPETLAFGCCRNILFIPHCNKGIFNRPPSLKAHCLPSLQGSFLGMLPGTYAFVGTGHVGKAVFLEGSGSLNMELWQVGLAGGSCTHTEWWGLPGSCTHTEWWGLPGGSCTHTERWGLPGGSCTHTEWWGLPGDHARTLSGGACRVHAH